MLDPLGKLDYERHIIVCNNFREDGSCCAKVGGPELYARLKELIARKGLKPRIKLTRSRCLGFCNDVGATVCVYPERVWFRHATPADFDEIVRRFLPEEARENPAAGPVKGTAGGEG